MKPKHSTVAFTIADSRIASCAEVLLDDLARFRPQWDRVVVSPEKIRIRHRRKSSRSLSLTASEIGMTESIAFRVGFPGSSVLESMIPWGFDGLFEIGYHKVIYFGPRVRCYSPMTEFSRAMNANDAVLIPRVLQPFTDTLTPGDRELRESGYFDSEMVGLSNTRNVRFLVMQWMDAWRNLWLHPEYKEACDPAAALLDLLPSALENAFILRNSGYQVSRWNLHNREITFNARLKKWKLHAGPFLCTLNFNGLVGDGMPGSRLRREAWPGWLCRLTEDYLENIKASGTSDRKNRLRFSLDRSLPISPEWHPGVLESSAVRGALLTADSLKSAGRILREFVWLPDSDIPDLPWLLAEACRKIPRLQRYAERMKPAQLKARLKSWFEREGSKKCRIPLAPPVRSTRRGTALKPAVNIFGYFTAQNGLAEAARSTARAYSPPFADCHNVNYLGGSPSPYAHPGVSLSLPHANPDIDIVHLNCDGVPLFYNAHAEVWNRPSYKIGFWLWELETLPVHARDNARLFNEIWCCSEFNRECFEQIGDMPVRMAPLLVNPKLASMARLKEFQLPGSLLGERPHLFLTMADFFSCPERKNPLASIEAYIDAFPRDNGETGLLVKASNTGIRPDYLELLRQTGRGRTDIQFLLGNLDAAEVAQLMKRSAALVSLHTTEGYGLPIAEALALGRPVIATGYGGNVGFCQHPKAHLVGYSMETLNRQIGPYERGTHWASPNLQDAARAYRQIYQQRRNARDTFQPRVEKFNEQARRQYRDILNAALQRSKTHPGIQVEHTRMKVAIFGAGSGGELLYGKLFRRHDVVCFIDNDRAKIGQTLLGLPILSPLKIRELDVDRILIGSMYAKPIHDQLVSMGIPYEKMSLQPRNYLSDLTVKSGRNRYRFPPAKKS